MEFAISLGKIILGFAVAILIFCIGVYNIWTYYTSGNAMKDKLPIFICNFLPCLLTMSYGMNIFEVQWNNLVALM